MASLLPVLSIERNRFHNLFAGFVPGNQKYVPKRQLSQRLQQIQPTPAHRGRARQPGDVCRCGGSGASGEGLGVRGLVGVSWQTKGKPFHRSSPPWCCSPQDTKIVAYYIACESRSRKFLLSLRSRTGFQCPAIVWLYIKAKDLFMRASTPQHEIFSARLEGSEDCPDDQFSVHAKQDFWVTCELSDLIQIVVFRNDEDCSEDKNNLFVSSIEVTAFAKRKT